MFFAVPDLDLQLAASLQDAGLLAMAEFCRGAPENLDGLSMWMFSRASSFIELFMEGLGPLNTPHIFDAPFV